MGGMGGGGGGALIAASAFHLATFRWWIANVVIGSKSFTWSSHSSCTRGGTCTLGRTGGGAQPRRNWAPVTPSARSWSIASSLTAPPSSPPALAPPAPAASTALLVLPGSSP